MEPSTRAASRSLLRRRDWHPRRTRILRGQRLLNGVTSNIHIERKLMLRILLATFAVASLLVLPSCMKMEMKNNFNADNTGTISMKMSIKTEVIDNIRAMTESAGGEEGARESLDKVTEATDEKANVEKMKNSGVEIISSKTVDKDGWKGFEIEGKIADVNAYCEKAAKIMELEAASAGSEGGRGPMDTSDFGEMALSFFKTADPAVGSMQIIPPMGDRMSAMGGADNPLARLDEASEEELQMFEGMMEMMKGQFALDQMSMSMVIGVPGDIVAMKGCTKTEDSKGVVFNMKGGDINIASIKTMMGLKEGVSVDFKIPADCKITFKERPKKDAPAPAKEEKKKEEKKGGLKIGEGGGKDG